MSVSSDTDSSSNISEIVFYSLAYVALFFYYLSFIDYGLNLWDEGGFAYGTLRTYEGQMAIRDFNPIGYLPGRYWYASFFYMLFGVDLFSLRLSVLVLTPLMVLSVYAISIRLMTKPFALSAALMMASAPSMYYNRFYPFFCVILLHLAIRYFERPDPRRAFYFWMLLFVCLFFKMEVALFSAVIFTFIYFLNKRTMKYDLKQNLIAGENKTGLNFMHLILILTLCFVSFFLFYHNLPARFFQFVYSSYLVWGNPFPEIGSLFSLLEDEGFSAVFESLLFYLPPLTYFILGGVLIHQWTKMRCSIRRSTSLSLVLLFGASSFGLVIWRAGFDNLIRTLPAFYIAASYLLFFLWQKFSNKIALRSIGQGLLLICVLSFPALFTFEMQWNHGFYVGSAGAIRQNQHELAVNRVKVFTNAVESRWVKKISMAVREKTKQDEKILALPLNPLFYFITNRNNIVQYDWILPGMLTDKKEKELRNQLDKHPPALVIFSNIAIDGIEDRRFSNYSPNLYNFLSSNYREQGNIGVFYVLLPIK